MLLPYMEILPPYMGILLLYMGIRPPYMGILKCFYLIISYLEVTLCL